MSYRDFAINSLTSSAYSAGLSYVFGWANPAAAAAGTLSSKVGQKIFGALSQPLMLSTAAENENDLSTRQLCAFMFNTSLMIGSVIATSYASNYIGKQIDPDYNYLQTSWNEFKVNIALGVGALVLTLALTTPQEAQEKESETSETPALT